jgi:hypothetical protein
MSKKRLLNKVEKAELITFKNLFVKIGNPTDAMKYEIGALPEFNPFEIRIVNGIWRVHTPDGECIPCIKTTNVYQDCRDQAICTFTAYCYIPGFKYIGAGGKADTISLKHGPAIVMPSGTEYPVKSFSVDVNSEDTPVCTVVVPVVFVND